MDHYPADRINTQVIYRFTLAREECTRYFSLNNYKQNMMSLSLLAGGTVICVVVKEK